MMLKSDLKLPTYVIEFQAAKTKRFFGELHAANKGIQPIPNSIMPQALGEDCLIEGRVVSYENFRLQSISEIFPQIGESRSIVHILPRKMVNAGKNKPAGRRPD
jgi:hypothetical protein